MSSIKNSLAVFRALFEKIVDLPYCTGTVPLDPSSATLFYRLTAHTAGTINFSNPSEDQLSALAEACQKATFGLNQKDVLDETYRKAGKMDMADFATQFSPTTSGIIDIIHDKLLRGPSIEKSIKVEPYKLNVYGPGSFFKAHVDTPRSDKMFGSLVVIFPTTHEGGSLVFRHGGKECTFDTARAVSSQELPHVAFVAFYSDVEHEVSVVTSGYRVTLTYNLYWVDSPSPKSNPGIIADSTPLEEMKATLESLLADPEFIHSGRRLGFGLSHKYPFNPNTTRLEELEERLKGSDARTRNLCKALSLNVSLKALYTSNNEWNDRKACLLDHFAGFEAELMEGEVVENDILDHLKYNHGATLVHDIEIARGYHLPILWVKPRGNFNSFQQAYMAHGNEAMPDHAYGEVCLVAEIGKFEK